MNDPYQSPPPRPGLGMQFLQSFLVAGCATVIAPFALVFGVVVLVVAILAFSGVDETALDTYTASDLRSKVVRQGDPGAGTIALVTVHGAITGSGSALEGDGALAFVAAQLRQARDNDAVKAVLLQVDSPGGGLTASDMLHHEVALTRQAGKPVLAYAADFMASGGYYVAAAAEGIIASPTATVGSIGVIMQHVDVSDLLSSIGVRTDPVMSGEFKDIGSMTREMSEEERALLQQYVDASHSRFVAVVAEGRGLDEEAVRQLATGMIYTAAQARDNGLVDRVGYIEDAIAWTEEVADESGMRVITYKKPLSFDDFFREAAGAAAEVLVDRAAGPTMKAAVR